MIKNKFNVCILALILLFTPTLALAENPTDGTTVESEEVLVNATPSDSENSDLKVEDYNVQKSVLNPNKKNDFYTSKGTIIENLDDQGKSFKNKKTIEVFDFKTNAGNNLHFLVDYSKKENNIVLLGIANEQELSSMVDNITKRQEIEKLNKQIEAEKKKAEEKKREEEQESKDKRSLSNLSTMIKIIPFLIAGLIIITLLMKRKKKAS
ncbi:hypothetical protein LV469_01355 [Peptoniphilus sp. GNH]|nr:hypothetical protein LV469_01355 [Peptoniphilus sp. GNH]